MHTNQLKTLATDALNDLKALEITTLDVHELTTLTDVMIICTGRSTRHVKSLAENIVKKAKESRLSYIKTEGEKEGEWVIVDLADVIIHIMLPQTRSFYKLEDLWEPIIELREPDARSSSGHR
jgi:ribosome-associated protein